MRDALRNPFGLKKRTTPRHRVSERGKRTIMMHQGQIIDDISEREKSQLTVEDLLEKFAALRKSEKLTDEIIEQLTREYL